MARMPMQNQALQPRRSGSAQRLGQAREARMTQQMGPNGGVNTNTNVMRPGPVAPTRVPNSVGQQGPHMGAAPSAPPASTPGLVQRLGQARTAAQANAKSPLMTSYMGSTSPLINARMGANAGDGPNGEYSYNTQYQAVPVSEQNNPHEQQRMRQQLGGGGQQGNLQDPRQSRGGVPQPSQGQRFGSGQVGSIGEDYAQASASGQQHGYSPDQIRNLWDQGYYVDPSTGQIMSRSSSRSKNQAGIGTSSSGLVANGGQSQQSGNSSGSSSGQGNRGGPGSGQPYANPRNEYEETYNQHFNRVVGAGYPPEAAESIWNSGGYVAGDGDIEMYEFADDGSIKDQYVDNAEDAGWSADPGANIKEENFGRFGAGVQDAVKNKGKREQDELDSKRKARDDEYYNNLAGLAPPQLDQAAVQGLVDANNSAFAQQQAQGLRAAMERGARMGMSPEAQLGNTTSIQQHYGVAAAQSEAQTRMQAEMTNLQAEIDYWKMKAQAFYQMWAMSNDRESADRALAAAKEADAQAFQRTIAMEQVRSRMSAGDYAAMAAGGLTSIGTAGVGFALK